MLILILRPIICILLPVHYISVGKQYQTEPEEPSANKVEVADTVDASDLVTLSAPPQLQAWKLMRMHKWYLWK